MRRRIAATLGAIAVLAATAGAGYFLGSRDTTRGLAIQRVGATDIADAMRDDRFYADYGQSTLVIDGTVASLTTEGAHTIISMQTASSFQARCDVGTPPRMLHRGDPITVLAEGGRAERQPAAVLLTDCVVL